LIDGAHNTAAAISLRQYIDTLNKPVTWVMGMLSTKDHEDIFEVLLKPADEIHLVSVPDHSSACQTYPDVFAALDMATKSAQSTDKIMVLCGSLYLIGYIFQHTNISRSSST